MSALIYDENEHAQTLSAVITELLRADKLPQPGAMIIRENSIGENCRDDYSSVPHVILPYDALLKANSGFLHLKRSLCKSAIIKAYVIIQVFKDQYLRNSTDPMAFEGPVAIFDGPEQYDAEL